MVGGGDRFETQRAVGQLFKGNVHIGTLPEKLVILRPSTMADDAEEELAERRPLGLDALFGAP